MKKVYLLTGLMALASLAYADNDSKWTGQIVPRIEIEDSNNYGGDEAHPKWIKKLNGNLKHKDYPNWTFIYEFMHQEKNTPHFFDNVDGETLYRIYPGIKYSRKVTDDLTLGLTLRDRWHLTENAEGKTTSKLNSYRIIPNFSYQVTDKLEVHSQVMFYKDIFYDRDFERSKTQRNSLGHEVYAGFTYRFAPGCFFLADYWEESWEKEHDSYENDKFRHQQIRPTLSLKVSEKNTIEFYGRIQILDGQVTRDNKKGKTKVERDRYGVDFIHRFSPSFILNVGFATEPSVKTTNYAGDVSKYDWFYYTGRLVYKF